MLKTANAIEIKNLRKSYGKLEALRGISFNLKKGEIFGLLGPNGAGKTTIINILSGILTKDSGRIRILGKDPNIDREFIANQMNVASAYSEISGILTVYENLKVYGKLYNVKDLNKRIDYLLDLFEIAHLKNKKFHTLSTGETSRVILCKGLINNPSILLLDECTVGLDPDIAEKTRKIIKNIQKKEKTSIIFTSHNMHEVEELCNRIAFLYKGKILRIGTAKRLKKLIKVQTVEIDFLQPKKSLKEFFKKLKVRILLLKKDKVIFELKHPFDRLHYIVDPLFKEGFKIKDLTIRKPTLEDVFIKIARQEL